MEINEALNITTKGLGRIAPHIMIDNSEEVTKYNAENVEALNTLIMCAKKYQQIQEIYERFKKDGGYFPRMAWIDVMEVMKDGKIN